ncbi:hypothetical protein SK128_012568 [Halocaridina rubra]|uniref:Uncharacterized protein n=1 Tax=Halocaridina rubra TaxID=373956 RepID=A0AAN8WRY2_HALRR
MSSFQQNASLHRQKNGTVPGNRGLISGKRFLESEIREGSVRMYNIIMNLAIINMNTQLKKAVVFAILISMTSAMPLNNEQESNPTDPITILLETRSQMADTEPLSTGILSFFQAHKTESQVPSIGAGHGEPKYLLQSAVMEPPSTRRVDSFPAQQPKTQLPASKADHEKPKHLQEKTPLPLDLNHLQNPAPRHSGILPGPLNASGKATIINGTEVSIGYMQEAFVYCFAETEEIQDLHLYRTVWKDPQGCPVREWESDLGVFTLGQWSYLPQSYLVFHDFKDIYAGGYECQLYHEQEFISSSTISVNLRA